MKHAQWVQAQSGLLQDWIIWKGRADPQLSAEIESQETVRRDSSFHSSDDVKKGFRKIALLQLIPPVELNKNQTAVVLVCCHLLYGNNYVRISSPV